MKFNLLAGNVQIVFPVGNLMSYQKDCIQFGKIPNCLLDIQ